MHQLDAARLIRLAVDRSSAGSALHAVAEEGVPTREIAEAIGHGRGVPVASVDAKQAPEHFGGMASFSADGPASHELMSKLLGWQPIDIGLLQDLNQGHYFAITTPG